MKKVILKNDMFQHLNYCSCSINQDFIERPLYFVSHTAFCFILVTFRFLEIKSITSVSIYEHHLCAKHSASHQEKCQVAYPYSNVLTFDFEIILVVPEELQN